MTQKQSPQRFAQVFAQQHPAPQGPKKAAHYELHGEIVEDNYKALEGDDKDAQEWRAAQAERLKAYCSASPHHDEHRATMQAHFNIASDSLPIYAGGRYFSINDDGESQKRTVLIRESLDAEPEVFLDPSEWDKEGKPYRGLVSGIQPSPDGSKIIVTLSNAGTAGSSAIIYDAVSGDTIEQLASDSGLKWAAGKSDTIVQMGWHEDKRHWCLREHVLGDDPANDKTTFEFAPKSGRGYTKHRTIAADKGVATHEFLTLHSGTQRDNGLYTRAVGESGSFEKLFDNGVNTAIPIAEVDGKLLVQTDLDAPMGRVVAVDYANPAPENWQTVIPENPALDLESVSLTRGKLFANYLQDAQSRISVFDTDGTHAHDVPLPEGCTAYMRFVGGKEGGLVMLTDSFEKPMQRHRYDAATNTLTPWDDGVERPALPEGCVVERIHATSKDGTQVPMTVVRKKDVELDGSAATILNGYGGFDIPMTPGFRTNMLHFIEQGGVYVQANLRGGGEFGQEWYDQGRLGNKQNVFDDFAACAETLIDQNYTKPERLAIHGASNGGLLVLATALQRPELFGAVISHAPVADLMDKRTWPSDYGVPRKSKEDFDVAREYSPLQNIEEGKAYPPMMVCTASHDDIVPAHEGQKFVAEMNEKNPDGLCLLLHEEFAGHYAGSHKTRDQLLDYHATLNDFVEQSLGPIDQQQYKAAAAEWEHPQRQPAKAPEKAGHRWRDHEESRRLNAEKVEVGHRI